MPGISGAELAERIAKDHPETGIVIISGLPLGLWPERDRRILAHMPRGYLFALKPLIPSVLVRRIRFAHSAAAQERV
jgi:DNA-binding NarL/FixJ family response regulator